MANIATSNPHPQVRLKIIGQSMLSQRGRMVAVTPLGPLSPSDFKMCFNEAEAEAEFYIKKRALFNFYHQ